MTDYTELKRLAEALLASDDHADFPGWMAASDAFDNTTGPAAVLALIAENEQLAKTADCWDRLNVQNKALSDSFRNERDQLKAENETLIAAAQALRDEWRKDQADAERYRWLRVKQTFIWLIQDWFPKNNVLTDVDAEIDAAIGKGEQS